MPEPRMQSSVESDASRSSAAPSKKHHLADRLSKFKTASMVLLIGVLCFLGYNANLRVIGAGDTLAARYLPLNLWHNGTLAFDANARLVAHGHPVQPGRNRAADSERKTKYFEPFAYWTARTRDHQLTSIYPIVTPLVVAPVYFPAVRWLEKRGWRQPDIDRVAELMEKLSASALASMASMLMYLVLRRDGNRWSFLLTMLFAFGTNTWMTSSQALWQHGTAEILIALALLLVGTEISPVRGAVVGLICVLMVGNRPPDGLIAGGFALYLVWKNWRNVIWLLAGAAIPLAALLYLNLHFLGHYAGGYALVVSAKTHFFEFNWMGLPGLLVSPGRGLLVFAPFLVFLPVGLMQRLRTPESRALAVALSGAVAAQLFLYSLTDWRGGASWGPRYLTDLFPILLWMLAPALLILRPLARAAFMTTAAASVAVQIVGAFWYTGTSEDLIFAGPSDSTEGAWKPANLPYLVELRHPPAAGDLLHSAAGSVDRIGETRLTGTVEIPDLEHGAVMEGWALAGLRAPTQVLLLIDGIVVGWSTAFEPRLDVSQAMRTESPSGWRVFASTHGVPTGKRVLQLAIRFSERSDIRIIRELTVNVIAHKVAFDAEPTHSQPTAPADLDSMAATVGLRLRERQSEHGFWLTSHTKGLTYEEPKLEMNTFLTAILLEMLTPLAQRHGLEDCMSQAQRHLQAQIEGNGLVRYHGLPNGPTIGTQGHVITPDSDDTALAWRLAGPGSGDPRLPGMLKELAGYRDSRGLYRTWLAPRKNFQGLDPGKDPNPTDIGIQMHVYLMLRQFDPAAAQDLYEAIRRSRDDDDMWVYYSKAPLIPYIRSAELQRLGCDIPLPVERLALVAKGQEPWSEAVRLLVENAAAPQDGGTRKAIRELLGRIGSADFALLHQSPPLLYHNDLSATVRRYYWSEDFGYALWLQLYEASGGKSGGAEGPKP